MFVSERLFVFIRLESRLYRHRVDPLLGAFPLMREEVLILLLSLEQHFALVLRFESTPRETDLRITLWRSRRPGL